MTALRYRSRLDDPELGAAVNHPRIEGQGLLRARLYEYSGHMYLVLADDIDVGEMLPISHDDARRVREALDQPHDHQHADCAMILMNAEGQVLEHERGFATPKDASALGAVLLRSTPHAYVARVEAQNGETLAVLPHGHSAPE